MNYKKIKFRLIETILWNKKIKNTNLSKNGFFLLKYHIDRLTKSAKHFKFKLNKNLLIKKLYKLVEKFNPNKKYKIRILLNKKGNIHIQHKNLTHKILKPKKIILSTKKIDKNNQFVYHKTTNRKIYTQEYKKYKNLGYYDVLFKNNLGQITEFSQGNILLKINKKLITPPTSCGLLNGVFIKYLLTKQKNIIMRPIYEKDLHNAKKIFITNSVRGITEVKLITKNIFQNHLTKKI